MPRKVVSTKDLLHECDIRAATGEYDTDKIAAVRASILQWTHLTHASTQSLMNQMEMARKLIQPVQEVKDQGLRLYIEETEGDGLSLYIEDEPA